MHADDRARKEHRSHLQRSGICTLWIYRKRGQMSGKEQLRILAFVLPQLLRERRRRPKVRHYQAKAQDALLEAEPAAVPAVIHQAVMQRPAQYLETLISSKRPVTRKIVRSQMLVARSPIRSRLWLHQSTCVIASNAAGLLLTPARRPIRRRCSSV